MGILGFDKHGIIIIEPENMIGKSSQEFWNKYGAGYGIDNYLWICMRLKVREPLTFIIGENITALIEGSDANAIIIKQKFRYKGKTTIWS